MSRITVMGQVIGNHRSTIRLELLRYFSRSAYLPKRDKLLGWFGRPGGTRTRALFRAMDKQLGKKGEKPSITSNIP